MALTRLALRELVFHRGRNLLTLAGISLGVALVVAVSLVNRSITQVFSDTVDGLVGRAVLEVEGGEVGFDEDVLEVVRSEPGVEHAAPLVLGNVFLDDDSGASLAIVGVDMVDEAGVRTYRSAGSEGTDAEDPLVFLNSPDSVLVAERFARKRGLKVGDRLEVVTPVGVRHLTIRGILLPEGPARVLGESLALMDVFAAQRLLGRTGKFDLISITLAAGAPPDAVAASLGPRLPPGVSVQPSEQRKAGMDALVAAFRHTLATVSVFALIIGFCMAYNTLSTAVVHRQRELGVLRALGSRRRDILGLILVEAALLGLLGSVGGYVAGLCLASLLIDSVVDAASSQILTSLGQPSVAVPGAAEIAKATIGIAAALVAGWVPGRQASRVAVVEVLRPRLFERLSSATYGRTAAVGGVLLGCAGGLIAAAIAWRSPLLAGGSTIFLVVAFLLIAASGTVVLARRSQDALARLFGVQGALVAASVTRNARRTAFTAGVLAIGVVLHVAIATVHHSMKENILDENRQKIWADLQVSSAFLSAPRLASPIDGSLAAALRDVPGVENVIVRRDVHQRFRGSRVLVIALGEDYFADPRSGRLTFTEGDPAGGALRAVVDEGAVLVSHNFAFHFGVRAGDTLTLETPGGTAALPVSGVVVSHFDNTGTVFVGHRTYERWWHDPLVNSFHVLVAPGVDAEAVKERIVRAVRGSYRLRVLTGKELRDYVAEIVESTLRFNWPLEAAVLLVVGLGLADTLLVSVLGRTQEIGILRAVGARRRDVLRLIVLEGLVITALGAGIGLAGGIVIAVAWMHLYFTYLSGWIMDVHLPPTVLVTTLGIMASMALVAAAYPARWASRLPIVRSLAYE